MTIGSIVVFKDCGQPDAVGAVAGGGLLLVRATGPHFSERSLPAGTTAGGGQKSAFLLPQVRPSDHQCCWLLAMVGYMYPRLHYRRGARKG